MSFYLHIIVENRNTQTFKGNNRRDVWNHLIIHTLVDDVHRSLRMDDAILNGHHMALGRA